MILKELTPPIITEKLKVLMQRLPTNHPKRKQIEEEYRKISSGFKGQQSLEYYLSFLPHEHFCILHDVRLASPQGNYFFQMDLLILPPTFSLIVEVKNMSGKLTYDPKFQQIIRHYNNTKNVFQDPVSQVNRQKHQLKKFLERNKIHTIPPIFTLVVMSNPQSMLNSTSPNATSTQQIIRPDKLSEKINLFSSKHSNDIFSIKELKKLAELLIKMHQPYHKYDLLERYHISKNELIKGVYCPSYHYIPMQKQRYQWICSHCLTKDKEAHLYALRDYCLLFTPTISNAQFRDFIQISSRHAAKRLLQSITTAQTGKSKGTLYELPYQSLLLNLS